MSHKCETCGSPVIVVGHTTMHYEPVPLAQLRTLLEQIVNAQPPYTKPKRVLAAEALKLLDAWGVG